jgi:1-acyl-sn-glycerol-3-phosphate acyltransferase
MRALAAGLSENDGLVIYPEGTRFTTDRRARLIERLRAEGDQERMASAMRLTTVMPLKLGGAIAVLEANPRADVVFCSHAGLEKIRSIREVLMGKLVGVDIHVRFDRTAACDVPKEAEARKAWLTKQWEAVDAFVVAQNKKISDDVAST